jgi:GMP synthase (glutamine-hydrolysing)
MRDVETEITHAIGDRLPRDPERYDGVVLSGGIEPLFSERPWFLSALRFIERCAEKDVPLLGICQGHQMIARALIGAHAVRENHSPEFGWKEIRLVGEGSPLFHGIPRRFYSHCSHFHEVCELSSGFRLLAESDLCAIHAYEGTSAPVWGIQFHPEINIARGRVLLLLNSLANRKFLVPLKELMDARDSNVAPKLFSNFVSLAMKRG